MLHRPAERATSTATTTTVKCETVAAIFVSFIVVTFVVFVCYLTLHFVCDIVVVYGIYYRIRWALFAYFTAKMKLKSTRAFLMRVYMFYPQHSHHQ